MQTACSVKQVAQIQGGEVEEGLCRVRRVWRSLLRLSPSLANGSALQSAERDAAYELAL